jgi:hypothetical protein
MREAPNTATGNSPNGRGPMPGRESDRQPAHDVAAEPGGEADPRAATDGE